MAKVPALEQVLAVHDERAVRSATKRALTEGAAVSDVAESLVAYCEERLLAGDTAIVDACMFNAVHDGVPPHVLFTEIKRMARTPKERT